MRNYPANEGFAVPGGLGSETLREPGVGGLGLKTGAPADVILGQPAFDTANNRLTAWRQGA